jgi:hypothetical protein
LITPGWFRRPIPASPLLDDTPASPRGFLGSNAGPAMAAINPNGGRYRRANKKETISVRKNFMIVVMSL